MRLSAIPRFGFVREQMTKESYPEVSLLKQVNGVGHLIALTFVLTIENPHRFRKSRDVGCCLGLRPGRRNSRQSQPQLHISKEGDRYLRTMMVQGAHYTLGAFGENFDRGRWEWELQSSPRRGSHSRYCKGTFYCVGSMSCVNESVLIARSMGVSGGNKLGVRKFESKLKTRAGA
jgi:hypothetical protein